MAEAVAEVLRTLDREAAARIVASPLPGALASFLDLAHAVLAGDSSGGR